ncbi:MAG: LacI family DNA-binding transcriptional regulator [Intrasporangium sp.]|uniref:LacI family DNA-binding transcriptional regulator n=1 Tax=Intrasporangium sp. TaxID=1925024 RepID=UPI003F7FB5F6
MATIYEVAAVAGVSPATVSRVLNGARVSPEREARVRAAAEALRFTPNRTARSLRRRGSEVIALVIPDIENPFFTSLARGVEDTASQAGLSVVLCNTDEDLDKEARYLRIVMAENVAGVILAPASKRTDIAPLSERATPVVMVDRSHTSAVVDTVVVDNASGASRATELLYEHGYSLVACITGPPGVDTATRRAAGWRKVFTARHPERRADAYLRRADFRVDGGRAAIADLMSMPDPPDAVFVTNNLMSVGAIQWLTEARLGPPAVGIMSFGALPFATQTPAGVFVVGIPDYALGETAAKLLIERISGAPDPTRTIVLPTVEIDQADAEPVPEAARAAKEVRH